MIRLVVADDHTIVRDGLKALLAGHEDIQVVGEAPDGVQAIEQVLKLQPEVLLLDLAMQPLDGIEVLRQLTAAAGATRILVLSMHATSDYVGAAVQAGAFGYIVKGASLANLLDAIRSVAAGLHFWSPVVAGAAAAALSPGATRRPLEALTHRERQVLQMVAEGRTNREMGVLLGLSPKTVDTHRTRVMQKLDLHDVAAMTRFAIRWGLVSP